MEVENWNLKHAPEYQARYWTFLREGEGKVGTVYTKAYLLGGHTPVVYIRGAGAVSLTHVEPLEPSQTAPDGGNHDGE